MPGETNFIMYTSLIIQPDWEDHLDSRTGGKIWLTSKHPSQPGVHTDLEFKKGCQLEVWEKYQGRKTQNTVNIIHSEPPKLDYQFVCASSMFDHHTEKIESLDVNEIGFGVSGDFKGDVMLWDSGLGVVRHRFTHPGGVYRTRFFPSGK